MRSPDPTNLYWWHYRVIGSSGNGSVRFNIAVRHCCNPPTEEDLARVEEMHERALQHPGVSTAMTHGPMRTGRRIVDVSF